ncbi:DNA-3-methyladenine glycosylase [Agromyces intestinalis]|uniref:Putative 3-methyladenine DNA glycosylase n=1 Tax=Agromyces intestinalis TaxID=2592652 RepID=A0A5C1YB76_9MICO|nr:DNA-3-methyladenine glycosylase [Agromyces intestinalis]QEO13261.1 DNA-3-methyladenine glycosylase [Agromyces intestinalis]
MKAADLVAPDRAFFAVDPVVLAPRLLGAVLAHETADGTVAVRLVEVEAYRGLGEDPGSHAHRGPTPRTRVMFGDGGRLYAYFTYGMHTCLNIVGHAPGRAGAVLLRGAAVVEGIELARTRRGGASDRDLARGPARLAVALGVPLSESGADLLAPPYRLRVPVEPLAHVVATPRTGVSGAGGGAAYPWRFVLAGEPAVSVYRRHARSHD